MCGRYTEIEPSIKIKARFNVDTKLIDWKPRYNAAPSEHLPVILNTDPKSLTLSRWGLKPKWLKEIKGARSELINIRAEGLLTKRTFQNDFENRRCLVIADGFFEWKKEGGGKTPYYIKMRSGGLFAFAGLWEVIENSKGEKGTAFAIITVEPNELMSPIHNRMPAILRKEDEKLWLRNRVPSRDLHDLLSPYPRSRMEAYTVSQIVNSPSNDVPAVIHPVGA